MTSKLTREWLQHQISAIEAVGITDSNTLAAFKLALAAMDSSESVELPLDYLQGHKDGLEWAARLAEANHPDTGDWLYDDPIELAKAIRKGPDMPPVQPVADSEPDRNPVLAYADSYRDMAKQGVESVPIWSVITDLERNIAPLYRHAQPVTVVPEDVRQALSKMDDEIIAELDTEESDCRAAMLQERQKSAGVSNNCRSNENVQVLHTNSPAQSDCCPAQNVVVPAQSPIDHGYLPECECSGCKATARICAELAGNSQVIPDGYVMVPMRLTAENGAKGALSGEFSETKFVNCPECFGDDECETCDGSGRIEITVPVTWTTIKEIWAKVVEHFAAAPQSPGIEPATVPGKWIPVSERMPIEFEAVIAFDGDQVYGEAMYSSDDGFTIDGYEPCDRLNLQNVTHWMPLPAGPQEVK
ncbi:Eaa1 [Klebsiella pneumoniae]|nr:Eaa1 [Klebsiella pneumoniae]SLV67523.1 Eaa1 [Klebsiella pneumoniae]SLX66393.1 Eaa1 [Klebsiella pneumoniae]SLX89873.1 Eaa1 [Klebsiella pneumoniae]SLZ84319.1 Eaa1 [Klebsiella pneumoniae]